MTSNVHHGLSRRRGKLKRGNEVMEDCVILKKSRRMKSYWLYQLQEVTNLLKLIWPTGGKNNWTELINQCSTSFGPHDPSHDIETNLGRIFLTSGTQFPTNRRGRERFIPSLMRLVGSVRVDSFSDLDRYS